MIGAPGLIWDACDLLNLAATGRASDILSVLGCPSYVVKEVREGEVLSLRKLPTDDQPGELVAADLTPLLTSGALTDVELTEYELALFVHFAAAVDDGEARSLAAAASRNLWLVTDDRPALRTAREHTPPILTITTPDWMKYWAETAMVDAEALSDAIRRIQVCANFIPRRIDPLKSWWDANAPQ